MRTLYAGLIALFFACSLHADTSDPYRTLEPVDFTLPVLGGGAVSLSDFTGQWVILNYWATWCAPCRKEIPELMSLHGRREDIIVLGLAYEEVEAEVFEDFLSEFKPNYPIVLVDVFNPPEPFGAPRVLPTTIILEPSGRAVKGFIGPVTGDQLEAFIDDAGTP